MKLIVGLGNPGKEYSKTLHNVGFLMVDFLAEKLSTLSFERRFQALVSKSNYMGEPFILMKPQTYMNLSGNAVSSCLRYYKILPEDLLIIYDDVDLIPGKVRFRVGGSDGGHRGVRSIIEHLNTKEFNRVRIGIGRPQGNTPVVNYVLSPWPQLQYEKFQQVKEPVTDNIIEFIRTNDFKNTSFSCS